MRILKSMALAAIMLMCSAAHATHCTNGALNYPTCTPPTPTPQPPSQSPATSTSSSTATSTSSAAASARQGQHQAQQQGQQQNATGIGQGGSATAGGGQGGALNDSSSFSSRMYVLPAPVFTPPMAAVDCPAGVDITNEALAIGWNAVSAARGHTDNSACVLITLRNAYVEQCQFASAKQVQDLLTAKMLPGFAASSTVYLDLTLAECDALHAPPKAETVFLPVPQVVLPEVKAKPRKRVHTVLPCERMLMESKTWQCKPKG